METPKPCASCRKPVAADAPRGLCPACLMKVGLGLDTASGEPADPSDGVGAAVFVPPPLEELARCFPQLEVLELIGRGGMGVVYKARQPGLDRFVALKVLAREKERNPEFAERFTREARTLARLSHPNIVSVYDFGEVNGLYYLVMEFVDGLSLRQLLQAHKMTSEQALAIVPRICEALQFAHERGVVHQDIKPENVLVDKQGQVKIADFGIAKILGAPVGQASLTGVQGSVGTPHYMAPEQVEKPRTVDHRADIYSLGVVFYELLTGELPLGKFPPPSRKVRVDVRLDEVVLRALEKEPERRYQQASQVKTAVETIASTPASEPVAFVPPALQSKKRHRGRYNLADVIVAALMILLGILLMAIIVLGILSSIGPSATAPEVSDWFRQEKSDSVTQDNTDSRPARSAEPAVRPLLRPPAGPVNQSKKVQEFLDRQRDWTVMPSKAQSAGSVFKGVPLPPTVTNDLVAFQGVSLTNPAAVCEDGRWPEMISTNFAERVKWLFLSAAQGDADAARSTVTLDTELSQKQFEAGKRRAHDWLEQRKAEVRDVEPPWFAIAASVLLAPIVAGGVAAFVCRLFTSRHREPPWTIGVLSVLLGALVVPAFAVIFDLADWFGQEFSLYLAAGIAAVVAIIIVAGSRGEYERRLSSAAGSLMGVRHHHHHSHRKPWLSLVGSSLMVIVAMSFLIVKLSSFGWGDGGSELRSPRESRWEELKIVYPSRLNLSEEAGVVLPLSVLALLIGGIWLGFTVWGWSDDVRRRVHRHAARGSEFG